MQTESLLQYGELVYAAIIICVLICLWLYVRRSDKSHQPKAANHSRVAPQADGQVPSNSLSMTNAEDKAETKWWNHQDFPYSAPWWLRYPASIAVFAGAYWAFFEWNKKAGWILGFLFAIIGLGLVRELFVGALLAVLAGLLLWALGAAVAALPVSVAIIIGAMIIAQAVRR